MNITNLDSLMESPCKLRLIPFCYSLLTAFYTYQIGKKFFTRNIALLATGILITTIPFFNFSLQIRGYGLSTLFLTMIVYYSLAYSKTARKVYLPLIAVISTLIFYTIPSNIYSLTSLMFVYGTYLLLSLNKSFKKQRRNTFKMILSDANFQIFISILLGVLASLILYYPIFRDVFMNDYARPGSPFMLSSLKFYTSNIFTGMISGRWLLVGVSLIGFLFGLRQYKKWQFPIVIFLIVCILPVLIVFARGYRAPLRTFTVDAPFFSLLFAIGFCAFVDLFVRHKRIFAGILLGAVLGYSLFIFGKELTKINNHILNDIINRGRSQNLYYQYYSSHYQPLKDIENFEVRYNERKLPVLVHGCEPHGVSNYLTKFEIPYSMTRLQPNALDSLLSVSDSLYIITNHPFQFDNIQEYETVRLNKDLTYHNVMLLSKSRLLNSKIRPQINILTKEYKDSINFVFSVSDSFFLKDISKTTPCYFITEANKNNYGEIIRFVNSKPYLCYLETQDRNSNDIYYIVNDSFQIIQDYQPKAGINFYLARKTKNKTNANAELYFNSFDNSIATNSSNLIDSAISFSGLYSVRLDKNNAFSSPFSFSLDKERNNTVLKVTFMGSFNKDIKAVVVMEVMRKEKQLIWKGNAVNRFFDSDNKWQKVITTFRVEENLMPGDILKTYIWSPEKENIWIDDLKIEMIKQ